MMRLTLWHTPQYFQFFVRSPGVGARGVPSDDLDSNGFSASRGEVIIRTLSEYSEVPITVEYDADGLTSRELENWDHIVECSIDADQGKLVFEGCASAKPFGELVVPPGRYRIRIHFGGQLSGKRDGSTEDFYLLQIWPSEDSSVKVLKGELSWPRPKQPR